VKVLNLPGSVARSWRFRFGEEESILYKWRWWHDLQGALLSLIFWNV